MARLSDKLAQHAQKPAAPSGLQLVSERTVLTELLLTQIEPDPEQPRKDLGDLTELAASIRQMGVVQPIIVTVAGFDRYRVLAGERRFQAARLAGLLKVPAIVRTVEEQERLQLQIIENLHRKDLTPFEEALAYRALSDQFRLTQEDIAKRLGRSQESVNETIRLLALPEIVQTQYLDANRVTGGKITRSLLLEIVRRPEREQLALWDMARRGELTVKKARSVRTRVGKGTVAPAAAQMFFRYPIHLEGVTITVEFEAARATIADVVVALEAALVTERARLSSD
jgi:ParB/RepB/Spo0J family partition protein